MEESEKSYQVIISSGANFRMYEHFEFLARASENAANRLIEGLLKDIRTLSSDPYRYPVYISRYCQYGKYRYILSNKRYRIIYQVIGNQVYVDDIQDCRQDADKNIIN
jgi:predicted butyrate kinase (DUF1464 family)